LRSDVRVLTEDDSEIQLKEMSEYDEPTGIDSIIKMNSDLESEENLFAGGFSEEKTDTDEDANDITSDNEEEY
jgi:DNA-directed RNA polymerase subunit beta